MAAGQPGHTASWHNALPDRIAQLHHRRNLRGRGGSHQRQRLEFTTRPDAGAAALEAFTGQNSGATDDRFNLLQQLFAVSRHK